MYPEKCSKYQNGAGLPIALFIITVLSLIVLSMGQLQESSGKAISLQIQSQRAFLRRKVVRRLRWRPVCRRTVVILSAAQPSLPQFLTARLLADFLVAPRASTARV